jgi:hypothetical protein
MARAAAFAILVGICATPAPSPAAELFPVQPLGVERDNLDEAYDRARSATPQRAKALAARRADFLAFAAKVCSGPEVRRDPCLGRLYNNQAQAFDIPVRTAGPIRIEPVQAFGRAGGKAYSLNLVELSRRDGKPDPDLAAFNRAIRARALELVAQRGEPDALNDVNVLVSSIGGGLVSAALSIGLVGYRFGHENEASEANCLAPFPWVLGARRGLKSADLFEEPDGATTALKSALTKSADPKRPFLDGGPRMAEQVSDTGRWGFTHANVSVVFDVPACFGVPDSTAEAPLETLRPYLRKAGAVDLTALEDVNYD